MRKAAIFYKEEKAGQLVQHDDGSFTFRYDDQWFVNDDKPAISLTLPKSQQEYSSEYLFPFFFNLLPEGANKSVVCKLMRVDPKDHFGLLMVIAETETIGAISVKQIK